jgi:transposase-like protein
MDFIKYFEKLKSSAENNTSEQQTSNVNSAQSAKILEKENLSKIKHLVDLPKEEAPNARFEAIKKTLTEEECYNVVREERWQPTIYCPNCYSTDVQVLDKEQQLSAYNFKYLCLMCRSRFNDDTKTPFEFRMPPIDVWIQCWFLLGCSNSIEYIAAKLNMDINTVKQMVQELQNTFKTKQPLTRTMNYEEWSKQYSQICSKTIKENILTRKKENELHGGVSINQETDTAETRRQKNRTSPQTPKNKRF